MYTEAQWNDHPSLLAKLLQENCSIAGIESKIRLTYLYFQFINVCQGCAMKVHKSQRKKLSTRKIVLI